MAKYMFLLAGDEEAWESQRKEDMARHYAEIERWWDEQVKAGRIVAGHELAPTTTATTVRAQGGRVTVTDGPFIESKEAFGGYAIVDVPDLDAAIALAKSIPRLETCEIRPIRRHPGEGSL